MKKINNELKDIVKYKVADHHTFEEWCSEIFPAKKIEMVTIQNKNLPELKASVNNLYTNYLSEMFSNEIFEKTFVRIRSHLEVLSLSSIDFNFIRKTRTITMAEIRYDSSEPFCAIETEDGETYYFSYSPAQNTEYCLCSEEDEGYHQEHDCVGIHCDWHIPVITKVHPDGKIIEFLYQGLQKDLW